MNVEKNQRSFVSWSHFCASKRRSVAQLLALVAWLASLGRGCRWPRGAASSLAFKEANSFLIL